MKLKDKIDFSLSQLTSDVRTAFANLNYELPKENVGETQMSSLDLDSLDAIEFVMELEDQLYIEIPDEDAEELFSGIDEIDFATFVKRISELDG